MNTNEIFKEDPNSAYHPNNATVLPGVMSYTQAAWTEHVGNALVEETKLIINDSVIDHQYGVWFDIWQELTNRTYQKEALDKMLGTQKKVNYHIMHLKNKYFTYLYNSGLIVILVYLYL